MAASACLRKRSLSSRNNSSMSMTANEALSSRNERSRVKQNSSSVIRLTALRLPDVDGKCADGRSILSGPKGNLAGRLSHFAKCPNPQPHIFSALAPSKNGPPSAPQRRQKATAAMSLMPRPLINNIERNTTICEKHSLGPMECRKQV